MKSRFIPIVPSMIPFLPAGARLSVRPCLHALVGRGEGGLSPAVYMVTHRRTFWSKNVVLLKLVRLDPAPNKPAVPHPWFCNEPMVAYNDYPNEPMVAYNYPMAFQTIIDMDRLEDTEHSLRGEYLVSPRMGVLPAPTWGFRRGDADVWEVGLVLGDFGPYVGSLAGWLMTVRAVDGMNPRVPDGLDQTMTTVYLENVVEAISHSGWGDIWGVREARGMRSEGFPLTCPRKYDTIDAVIKERKRKSMEKLAYTDYATGLTPPSPSKAQMNTDGMEALGIALYELLSGMPAAFRRHDMEALKKMGDGLVALAGTDPFKQDRRVYAGLLGYGPLRNISTAWGSSVNDWVLDRCADRAFQFTRLLSGTLFHVFMGEDRWVDEGVDRVLEANCSAVLGVLVAIAKPGSRYAAGLL